MRAHAQVILNSTYIHYGYSVNTRCIWLIHPGMCIGQWNAYRVAMQCYCLYNAGVPYTGTSPMDQDPGATEFLARLDNALAYTPPLDEPPETKPIRYLYIAVCLERDHIKVGITSTLRRRCRILNGQVGGTWYILHHIDCSSPRNARKTEADALRILGKYRINGTEFVRISGEWIRDANIAAQVIEKSWNDFQKSDLKSTEPVSADLRQWLDKYGGKHALRIEAKLREKLGLIMKNGTTWPITNPPSAVRKPKPKKEARPKKPIRIPDPTPDSPEEPLLLWQWKVTL